MQRRAGRSRRTVGVPVIATTAAHFATPDGRLAMAMAAIRARQSLDDIAGWLAPAGGALSAFGCGDGAVVRGIPGCRAAIGAFGP